MGYLQKSFDAWGHQLGLGHCGTLLFPMFISQFSLRENNKVLLSVLKCSSRNLRSNVSETTSTGKKRNRVFSDIYSTRLIVNRIC